MIKDNHIMYVEIFITLLISISYYLKMAKYHALMVQLHSLSLSTVY